MNYALILAEMAYDANLAWSIKTDLVVDGRSWKELKRSEQDEYEGRMDRMVRKTSFPCFDNSGLAQSELSAGYLHAMWLQTAKDDHPTNKPWGALNVNERAKCEIYLGFIEMCQRILKNFK